MANRSFPKGCRNSERAIAAGFATVLLALLAFAGTLSSETHPRYGGAVRISMQAPVTLDPASGDTLLIELVHRRLFEYSPEGQLTSRFFDARREGDRWILSPRTFLACNSAPLTTEIYARCLRRGLLQGSFPAVSARRMLVGGDDFAAGRSPDVSGIESLPDGGMVLHTNGAQPLLPHLLTRAPFCPVVEAEGRTFGCGPFKVAETTTPGSLLTLVANSADIEPYVQRVEVVGGTGEEGMPVLVDRVGADGVVPAQVLVRGGAPRTLLLGLNPRRAPFSSSAARRDFLGSLRADRLSISPGRADSLRVKCSYLPQMLGAFPAVSGLNPEGAPSAAHVLCGPLPFDAARLISALPAGTTLDMVSDEEFHSRLAAGDYEAFLLLYEHRFRQPVLDLLEMLADVGLTDPVLLDTLNRLSEALHMEDRALALETALSAQRSLAESGLLFPLAEYSPAVRADGRLRDLRLDLFWHPILEGCWIDDR